MESTLSVEMTINRFSFAKEFPVLLLLYSGVLYKNQLCIRLFD